MCQTVKYTGDPFHRIKIKKVFRFLCLAAFSISQAAAQDDSIQGTVVGWGGNSAGQATGIYTPESYFATGIVSVAGQMLGNVTAISAGWSHCLALKEDGTVVGWGSALLGESTGSVARAAGETNGLVRIDGRLLTNAVAIAAGRNYSMALTKDGRIATWGKGPRRADVPLAAPKDLTNATAIAVGWNFGIAATRAGKAVGFGGAATPRDLTNVIAVATGFGDFAPILALKKDGSVVSWTAGGLEPVPLEATNVISISVGGAHSLALRRDGTLVGWGSNRFGEATGVPTTGFPDFSFGVVKIDDQTLQNVVAIAAGREFSMALKRDGHLVVWGQNGFHQCDVPAALTNIAAIAAGDHVCLALITNSAVWKSPK